MRAARISLCVSAVFVAAVVVCCAQGPGDIPKKAEESPTTQASTTPPAPPAVPPSSGSLIDPSRTTIWNPGIEGGVPDRTTICATINASTYGNGARDARAGIQAALDSCPPNQVVKLSAGDFKILESPLELTHPVVLRGDGPTRTRLIAPDGENTNLVVAGTRWHPQWGASVNLAATAVKGARSVALASTLGLSAGDIVAIDQITDPAVTHWSPTRSPAGSESRGWHGRYNRPVGQMMEVASVSGATVTFTTPFHIDFSTNNQAQLTKLAGAVVKYAGVEDLKTSGGGGGQGHIWLHGAYVWAKNVETERSEGRAVQIGACFRCVLRDSYVHSTTNPTPGGGGYGVAVDDYTADSLVENNVVWNMNKLIVMRASGGGNVIGYNYMDDAWIEYAPTWVEVGLNASHMTTPHFELFEGNQSFNFDGDDTWGNAFAITVFRNHLTGKRRSAAPLRFTDESPRRAIGLFSGHWNYNFVGNVLGHPEQGPAVYEDTYPFSGETLAMWRLGPTSDDENWSEDKKVVETTYRTGNFDYASGSVHWSGQEMPIPDSLYLTAKPSFFGSNPWPWVDPTGATKTYTLPARARFDALQR